MAQSNRIKMLTILILIWVLITSRVEAAPLPGTDGFPVRSNPPGGRLNRNKCQNYGIISRSATSAGSKHNNNQQDSYHEPSLNSTFDKNQLQKKFNHAKNFGVEGNFNPANRDLYQRKLIEHMKYTHAYLSTYRGRDVYHYYNPRTNLNVMVDRNTNKFISGWFRLSKVVLLLLARDSVALGFSLANFFANGGKEILINSAAQY